MFLCVWQSLPVAWSDALRTDISRGVPHVGLHELHDSDSPQRKVEKASAENVLKQHKACGVVTDRCRGSFSSPLQWLANETYVQYLFVQLPVSLISGELKIAPCCRQHPAGDNVRTPGIRVPAQC